MQPPGRAHATNSASPSCDWPRESREAPLACGLSTPTSVASSWVLGRPLQPCLSLPSPASNEALAVGAAVVTSLIFEVFDATRATLPWRHVPASLKAEGSMENVGDHGRRARSCSRPARIQLVPSCWVPILWRTSSSYLESVLGHSELVTAASPADPGHSFPIPSAFTIATNDPM